LTTRPFLRRQPGRRTAQHTKPFFGKGEGGEFETVRLGHLLKVTFFFGRKELEEDVRVFWEKEQSGHLVPAFDVEQKQRFALFLRKQQEELVLSGIGR
jgi:hypothetical protein